MNYITWINNIKLQINILNIILIIIIKRSNKYSFMNISYRHSQICGKYCYFHKSLCTASVSDPLNIFFSSKKE